VEFIEVGKWVLQRGRFFTMVTTQIDCKNKNKQQKVIEILVHDADDCKERKITNWREGFLGRQTDLK